MNLSPGEFLQEIFRFCEVGNINFRYLPSAENVFRPLTTLPELPVFPKDENPYFAMATRNGGGKKEHILQIPCLWCDIDFKDTPEAEAKKALKEFHFPPSFVNYSGGGYHVYWLLREPLSKEHIPEVEHMLRRLAIHFKGDMAATDASRILRVPGTHNLKPEYRKLIPDSNPAQYTYPIVKVLLSEPSRRHELSDFDQYLPPDEKQTPSGEFKNPPGWQNEVLGGVDDGKRHKTALSLVGRYFTKGLKREEVTKIMLTWNLVNKPPVEESEIIQIISDVERLHAKNHPVESQTDLKQTTGEFFTDLENAILFAQKHQGKIRFCHKFNKWFSWSGKHWEMDASGEVWRLAKGHVLSLLDAAKNITDDKERATYLKEMVRLQNEKKLTSMLNLSRHMDGIPVAPEDLDKNLMLFNCDDGTVDLRTFECLPHDPKQLITKLGPFALGDTSDCPKWKEHLNLIMCGNHGLIDFLQRAFGSCLAGDNRNRKLFLLWGSGANGKSVTLEAIQTIMGDYAMKTPAETLLVKRFESIPNDLARLNGARFVYTSEVSDGKKMAEALVKEITGDKFITARFMRGEWFEFPITFKIFLATNHLPTIRGTDPAIWDRIMLIPFEVRIPEEQRRPREDLLDEFRSEGPEILKWLFYGCHDWIVGGLNPPPEVLAANVTYREQMDYLKGFLDDACSISEKAHVRSADVYAAYEKWTTDNGEDPVKKITFGKRLREKGFHDFRDSSGVRAWRGIGLLQGG